MDVVLFYIQLFHSHRFLYSLGIHDIGLIGRYASCHVCGCAGERGCAGSLLASYDEAMLQARLLQ